MHYGASQCTYRCVVLPDWISLSNCSGRLSGLNAPTGAWCSLTTPSSNSTRRSLLSQCTYRCVVLPDSPRCLLCTPSLTCLNAPTGAWCSLTGVWLRCSCWPFGSQCTYRCVVLPDGAMDILVLVFILSQCTYRCVVLPDPCPRERRYDATSRARSATGPGSTPPDRPAPGPE